MQENSNPYAESITVATSYEYAPGVAPERAHVPQSIRLVQEIAERDCASVDAMIRQIVREELQSMMEMLSRQVRMQNATVED